jgi:hypothetical protein
VIRNQTASDPKYMDDEWESCEGELQEIIGDE